MKDQIKKIKLLLWEYELKNSWLIVQLKKRGIEVDKSTMSEILNGRREGEKARAVVENALEILDWYEKKIENR